MQHLHVECITYQKMAQKYLDGQGENIPLPDHDTITEDIKTIQKHINSMIGLKRLLLKKRFETNQLHGSRKNEKDQIRSSLEEKLKAFEARKSEINKTMYEMCIDEHFLGRYVVALEDYRIHSLPLPYGFMCHKLYKRELDFLKCGISETKFDVNARRELLAEHKRKNPLIAGIIVVLLLLAS